MSGLYAHTTRASGTLLTAAIYNADHVNHITNQTPQMTDDYSETLVQMRSMVDPGGEGAEIQPASLAGELERIRFMLASITGKTYWYSDPDTTLAALNTTVTQAVPVGTVYPTASVLAPTGFLLCYGQAVSRTTYATLFAAMSMQRLGDLTAASAVVTNITTTEGMLAGMPINGNGIPAGTTILSVNSAVQITLSQAATITQASVNLIVLPFGTGDNTTTFNLPDCRGRVLAGNDVMGGVGAGRLVGTALGGRLGAVGGAETVVLDYSQMPSHTHGVSDPGHGHQVQVGGASSGSGIATGTQTSQEPRVLSGVTGITIASSGGGAAHGNVQPSIVVNYIIKY